MDGYRRYIFILGFMLLGSISPLQAVITLNNRNEASNALFNAGIDSRTINVIEKIVDFVDGGGRHKKEMLALLAQYFNNPASTTALNQIAMGDPAGNSKKKPIFESLYTFFGVKPGNRSGNRSSNRSGNRSDNRSGKVKRSRALLVQVIRNFTN
ncbi:MAG: hypothetical protein LBB20_02420 [Puniceicoccales bacterium]|jgi:hypothetical protein|nr:hypothetical protein [Puniceicoccales bacterium]